MKFHRFSVGRSYVSCHEEQRLGREREWETVSTTRYMEGRFMFNRHDHREFIELEYHNCIDRIEFAVQNKTLLRFRGFSLRIFARKTRRPCW